MGRDQISCVTSRWRQRVRQTDSQSDIQSDSQTDIQSDRQTDIQTPALRAVFRIWHFIASSISGSDLIC